MSLFVCTTLVSYQVAAPDSAQRDPKSTVKWGMPLSLAFSFPAT